MSDQNSVQVVRDAYAAFQRGDIPGLLALLAENIDWESPTVTGIAHSGPRRGKQDVAQFFVQLNESEEVQLFEPQEFIADGEKVAVLLKYRARVKATGRIAETPLVHIFTLQAGKITRFVELYDTAVAERAFRQAASA